MTITMNENIQGLDAEKMERVVGGVYGFESTISKESQIALFRDYLNMRRGWGPAAALRAALDWNRLAPDLTLTDAEITQIAIEVFGREALGL